MFVGVYTSVLFYLPNILEKSFWFLPTGTFSGIEKPNRQRLIKCLFMGLSVQNSNYYVAVVWSLLHDSMPITQVFVNR